jgi:two-component system, NtrC family, response regulator HydG
VVKTKSGATKYLFKNAQAIQDAEGNIIGGVESFFDITEQVETENDIRQLKSELNNRTTFAKIVGAHSTMQNIYDLIERAKDSSTSFVIYGESGTGKELVAHALHFASSRALGPFVTVHCAALAESILESELFGHKKGAFTNAIQDRKGRFEDAHGGTIFLDEIGDIPLSIQVKLLRFLQEKEIVRVGDNKPIKLDVRVISATHKDLKKMIAEGQFREDLYYRLNIFPINVPPLREKKTDIPLLADHFLKKFSRDTGKHITRCDQAVMDILLSHAWPGNIRELEHAIEYAFVLCDGETIHPEHLPEHLVLAACFSEQETAGRESETDEKARILSVLHSTGGNKAKASKILGYSRVTLWKKLKQLHIEGSQL